MRARVQLAAVIVVLAGTGGARSAGADGTSLEGLQVTAETAMKTANDTGDPDTYEVCGAAYVEVANVARTARPELVPEAMYNAATCFARGGSIGAAIMLLDRMVDEFPRHKLVGHATIQAAHLYWTIGWFDKAAQGYEEFAAKYAAEADARDALENAYRLRVALGDDAAAGADAERWLKHFGAKDARATAGVAFVLAMRTRERGKPDDAVLALRRWIKMYGGRDRELLVSAYLAVGELIWESSCPVKTVDGLCLARDRVAAAVPRCKGRVPLVGVARDATKAKEAQAALAQAVRISELAGGSDTMALMAGQRARLVLADARVEAATMQTLPVAELDPDGRMSPATAKAQAELLQQWQKSLADANGALEELARSRNGRVAVAAQGRIAWLAQHAADTLLSAPLPVGKSKKKVPFSEEIGAAYCDALGNVSEPLLVRARDVATYCIKAAGDVGIVEEARSCVAVFDQIDPATMGADERMPMPAQPRISDVEPPARYRAPTP